MTNFLYYWSYLAPSIDPYETIWVHGLYSYTEKQIEDFKKSNKIKKFTKDHIVRPEDVNFSKMIKSKEVTRIDSLFYVHFKHDVLEDFNDN